MSDGATRGWKWAKDHAHLTLEVPEGGGPMFFRRIEAGEFRMGSREGSYDEQPVHLVWITIPFYLAMFPVTQKQFRAWTQSQNVEHENHFSANDLLPAEEVDWNRARDYCGWLKANTGGLPEQHEVNLPTEAQWEFACRAGAETEFSSGDGEAALRRVGWFAGNSENRTHPVGGLERNDWGLFDMHGNVWEWCLDGQDSRAYRSRPDQSEEPWVPFENSSERVIRGGSWFFTGRCRSAYRNWVHPGVRNRTLGFRVCLLPGPGFA